MSNVAMPNKPSVATPAVVPPMGNFPPPGFTVPISLPGNFDFNVKLVDQRKVEDADRFFIQYFLILFNCVI
jgi:hypothetical protein